VSGIVYGTAVFTAEAEKNVVRSLKTVSLESKNLLKKMAFFREPPSSPMLDMCGGNWYRCPIGHVCFVVGTCIVNLGPS
jgi:hypothetical protein